MVKWTSWTLKRLSKWIIETDCSWVDLLLMALLRLRMTPQSQGYSPYEIVYGLFCFTFLLLATSVDVTLEVRSRIMTSRWSGCGWRPAGSGNKHVPVGIIELQYVLWATYPWIFFIFMKKINSLPISVIIYWIYDLAYHISNAITVQKRNMWVKIQIHFKVIGST